jgi:hypothetical protein
LKEKCNFFRWCLSQTRILQNHPKWRAIVQPSDARSTLPFYRLRANYCNWCIKLMYIIPTMNRWPGEKSSNPHHMLKDGTSHIKIRNSFGQTEMHAQSGRICPQLNHQMMLWCIHIKTKLEKHRRSKQSGWNCRQWTFKLKHTNHQASKKASRIARHKAWCTVHLQFQTVAGSKPWGGITHSSLDSVHGAMAPVNTEICN